MRTSRSGFTLLEMAVVLAILVVLAGAVIASLDSAGSDALVAVTRAELATLRDACLRYRADTGKMPRRLVDLTVDAALAPCPNTDGATPLAFRIAAPLDTYNQNTGKGWRGPYLSPARPLVSVNLTSPSETVLELADTWNRDGRVSYYRWSYDRAADLPANGETGTISLYSESLTPPRITAFGADQLYDGGTANSDDLEIVVR